VVDVKEIGGDKVRVHVQGKAGTTSKLGSRKNARRGGAWSARKLRRKVGDEWTTRRKAQQAKAALGADDALEGWEV
jgi:hypothetical protein